MKKYGLVSRDISRDEQEIFCLLSGLLSQHANTINMSTAQHSNQTPTSPFLVEVFDRVCLGQNLPIFGSTKKFRCFQPQAMVAYHGFCDDFGPMSLASTVRFIELLDRELEQHPDSRIVFKVDPGRRELTNAAYLLGAYMILRLRMTACAVASAMSWLDASLTEDYRDATFSSPDFGLTLQDCWRGLETGQALGWVQAPTPGQPSRVWGMVDVDEYAHWDDPLCGDLNAVVPGRFIAFRGPHDLGGRAYSDELGHRRFSPGYYADILRDLGATPPPSPPAASATTTSASTTAPPRRRTWCGASSISWTRRRGPWRCTARRGWGGRGRSSRCT